MYLAACLKVDRDLDRLSAPASIRKLVRESIAAVTNNRPVPAHAQAAIMGWYQSTTKQNRYGK